MFASKQPRIQANFRIAALVDWTCQMAKKKIVRIGVGGPVGSGKTAIVEAITPQLLDLGMFFFTFSFIRFK
jgi:hypothetical protein